MTHDPTADETAAANHTAATAGNADPDDLTPSNDPFDWDGGKTFLQMYLDGDSPWPEEPLLQNDRHPYEIADEYLSLLDQQAHVANGDDQDTRRRMTGEIEAATSALTLMDTTAKPPSLSDSLPISRTLS